MASQASAWMGTLVLASLLFAAAPAAAATLQSASADEPVCPAGTIRVGPFCVINPIPPGGSGVCPAGTIKVGPFCVINPL